MANLKKHSLWYMIGMSCVTIGLYPYAWIVDTARQLRLLGGKVPSTIFISYYSKVALINMKGLTKGYS